jgi:hypothetical protein
MRRIEFLEERTLLSVSTTIQTPFDTIPVYGATATATSIADGNWSQPTTWSGGSVPDVLDNVHVATSVVVDSADAIAANVVVLPGSRLSFQPGAMTKLSFVTLTVLPGGSLEIMPGNGSAELVVLDQPFDFAFDPQQFGHGVLIFGTVQIVGTERTPFARLAVEPQAGDGWLYFADPVVGWQAGDELLIPDSRQIRGLGTQQDVARIALVAPDGLSVQLAAPLQYDHPAALDGNDQITFLPHAANLTRSILVRSANPAGVRGHVLVGDRAEASIQYASFQDLGRTLNKPLNNTTFDGSGNVTRIGTNQAGRYSLHMHHLWGSVNPTNPYQYELAGNVVRSGLKWGIVVHDSHYGLVSDNVVFDVDGAGLVTESGNEYRNVITGNFVAYVEGSGFNPNDSRVTKGQSFGHEGAGYWLRETQNYINDNVAANVQWAGAVIFPYPLSGVVAVPKAPGADLTDPAAKALLDFGKRPALDFSGLEVYGSMRGVDLWAVSRGSVPYRIDDLAVWHHGFAAVTAIYTSQLWIDGLTVRGDWHASSITNVGIPAAPSQQQLRLTVVGADIQGVNTGLVLFAKGNVIQDSIFRNLRDVVMWNSTTVINSRFEGLPGLPHTGLAALLQTKFQFNRGSLIAPRDFVVQSYQGAPGWDFQVYMLEQNPSFVVPKTKGKIIGSPEGGLSNAENFAKYGIAIGGSVAPCLVQFPEIVGYVC